MKAKCIDNKIENLPRKLRRFAFTQDQYGIADITPGKQYTIYGIRHFKRETFYLVLTDNIRQDLPWWMPAQFYEVPNLVLPQWWTTKQTGCLLWSDQETTPPAFHGQWNEIVDKTTKGYEVFEKMKKAA